MGSGTSVDWQRVRDDFPILRREIDLAPRILSAHIRRTHIGLLERSEVLEGEDAQS